ncbi:sodium channel and clathrin linker 1 [Silurus meridionalis]|nr:sodium channel and clathrin linker 1 [Silurus meridionalis]
MPANHKAQLREKQRVEELERMKEGMKQLVEEAAIRTRKEMKVECVRQQCNTQINRLTEELAALQLECSDKQSQLERAHRERKVVEEELEKVYREGRYGVADGRKMEALHQRCLNAERIKDELEHTLNTTHSNMKKMELELGEELLRCQEEVRRLQVALSNTRTECSSVCEERLSLQQENQQLHRDMDTLRKECVSAQRHAKLQVYTQHTTQRVCVCTEIRQTTGIHTTHDTKSVCLHRDTPYYRGPPNYRYTHNTRHKECVSAQRPTNYRDTPNYRYTHTHTLRKECVSAQRPTKLQVSRMQQEVCVRKQAVESKLREMEERNKQSTAELQRRLQAQQHNNTRYREESVQLTHTLQHTLTSLRAEMSRQKQQCHDLENNLQSAQEKILEFEQELAEHQEKNTRLQTRLTQAEHRASTTSQQLTLMTQRRKAVSVMDLELLE